MVTRKRNSTTATAEPAMPTVLVEWLVNTSDASHEGGGRIGDRRYEGRPGQRQQMRTDDAEILAANGYVRYVAEAEQAR